MTDPDVPVLSRSTGADEGKAEVRVFIARPLVAVLDALAIQGDTNRTALVATAIKEYLERRLFDAQTVVRMYESANPTSSER